MLNLFLERKMRWEKRSPCEVEIEGKFCYRKFSCKRLIIQKTPKPLSLNIQHNIAPIMRWWLQQDPYIPITG